MSTASDTPVIVVEQHKLDVQSDDEEEDDDVFINSNAVEIDGEDSNDQRRLTPLQLRPIVGCPCPSPGLLKFLSAVQFVRTWAGRSARPLDYNDSAGSTSHTRPSKLFIKPNTPSDTQLETRLPERLSLKKLKYHIIWNPNGKCIYMWLCIVSLAVIYNAVILIVRETYHDLNGVLLPLWLLLDYISDIIYFLDIIVHGTTSCLHQGLMVTEYKELFKHYFKSKIFILDVLSMLPTDLLYLIPGIGILHTVVRINRFFRIHRVLQFLDRTESRTNYPNLFRVLQLILLITLIIHWNACFYFLISEAIGFGSDSWVYPALTDGNGTLNEYASLSRQYLFSFYWSTLTLTTIGELPGPVTDAEYVFVIFDFLIGVLIFATIVGMVGGIITNMNLRRAEFQENLDNLKQYMRYRHVGKDLQDRVIKWFDYQWTTNQTLNEEKILSSLPNKLQAEIAIHVHFETLKQVKIFEKCEAGLLEELVLKLKPQVFSPGDYVCRKGDVGREMYIIKHGRLEVVAEDKVTVYATLKDGGYFGEISILNLSANGNRRTASVRSVGYSDLFVLSKTDLLETLDEYPETKALLEDIGHKTLLKDGTLEGDAKKIKFSNNPLPAGNDGYNRRIEQLESNVAQLQVRFSRLLGEYNTAQMKLKQRIYSLETKN